MTAVGSIARTLFRHRAALVASTRMEIWRRHVSSLLGPFWIVLYPLLLLSAYTFTFFYVLGARLPGLDRSEYVLFIFCGLVPFLGFSEALNGACLAIRQNVHLVRNLLFPVELLPVRAVLVGLVSQTVASVFLVLISAVTGHLSANALWLPVVLFCQVLFLWGLAWPLSLLSVAVPDLTYFVNLILTFLVFISPIGFRPEMVPPAFGFVILLNPLSHFIEGYRNCLFPTTAGWHAPVLPMLLAAGSLVVGAGFFIRFKDALFGDE